jgi:hypothetical protein
MYIHILIYPENKYLYYASFAFANGPLAWALALVGCKFVLHSIDKLTSVFIHFTPMTLMWNMHWRTKYSPRTEWKFYDSTKDTFSIEFLKDFYIAIIGAYLSWATIYYLIMFVIAKKRIKNRGYGTLKSYYEEGEKGKKIMNKYGEQYSQFVYLGLHFVVSLFTMTVSLIAYFSFPAHCVLVLALSSSCFWNGATYYMDHFSKKYEVNLAKMDDIQKKIDQELLNMNKEKEE